MTAREVKEPYRYATHRKVLQMLAEGYPAKIIAMRLGLSINTVEDYVRDWRRYLDCDNRISVVVKALQRGYLNLESLFIQDIPKTLWSGYKDEVLWDTWELPIEEVELIAHEIVKEAIKTGKGRLCAPPQRSNLLVAACLISHQLGHPLPASIDRGQRKDHGTQKRYEGFPPVPKKTLYL